MPSSNAYMRKYKNNLYKKRRNEALNFLGGKCSKCRSVENLEIDHINPEDKSFHIHLMRDVSLQRFWEEIGKCQLLCKTCHREKTIKDRGFQKAIGTHGTLSSYRYCHCQLCKDAKAEWTREYRKTHRRSS